MPVVPRVCILRRQHLGCNRYSESGADTQPECNPRAEVGVCPDGVLCCGAILIVIEVFDKRISSPKPELTKTSFESRET